MTMSDFDFNAWWEENPLRQVAPQMRHCAQLLFLIKYARQVGMAESASFLHDTLLDTVNNDVLYDMLITAVDNPEALVRNTPGEVVDLNEWRQQRKALKTKEKACE